MLFFKQKIATLIHILQVYWLGFTQLNLIIVLEVRKIHYIWVSQTNINENTGIRTHSQQRW